MKFNDVKIETDKKLNDILKEIHELDYNENYLPHVKEEQRIPLKENETIRINEFNNYYIINRNGLKNLKILFLYSYSGIEFLKQFIKLNTDYQLDFNFKYNGVQDWIKIDLTDFYGRKYEDDIRVFLLELMNLLYLETFR